MSIFRENILEKNSQCFILLFSECSWRADANEESVDLGTMDLKYVNIINRKYLEVCKVHRKISIPLKYSLVYDIMPFC